MQFGSTARGDDDVHSDRDICIFVNDVPDRAVRGLQLTIAEEYGTDQQSVSAYRMSTARQMAASGSLFLWHLKLEGQVLHDRNRTLERVLGRLQPYRRHSEDLLRFQEVFEDTQRDHQVGRKLDPFDMHALFVVVRNVCMLLTAKAGRPSFGRSTVHSGAVDAYGRLPVTRETYQRLAACHLAYLRGADVALDPSFASDPANIFRSVAALLRMAWRVIE